MKREISKMNAKFKNENENSKTEIINFKNL
jgi:hypothetical protein